MRPAQLFIVPALLLIPGVSAFAAGQNVMVLTCHQTWNSRVYILDMDGQVLDWHQYDMYRLCDLEVVNGEIHVVDAFAPRSFILDLYSWDLQTIIDDWSLYYFYDLAYDGQYLYVTEWDMNRYLPDGTKDSSADFDHDSYGSCFAGGYMWTLCEDGLIHCWNTGNWPELEEVESASFPPPADSCRGLWHDGEYFWTAQALQSTCGWIIKFDSTGTAAAQWQAPAFTGWSACVYENYSSRLDPTTWAHIKSCLY